MCVRLSDAVLSLNMYGCFMNAKYLCVCLKRYANLSVSKAKVKGDLFSNWTFFIAEWQNNKIATGLREK